VAYQVIEDFRYGMDRRKDRTTGIPGSLWTIENAVINRGGEVERAKKWVSEYDLPTGETFGLASLDDAPYVFGSAASPAVPAGVTYQRLEHPDCSTAMTRVLSVDRSKGKLYVIARFADDSVHHYYDGERVRDWDAGRVTAYMLNNDGIAAHLVGLIANQGTLYTAVQVANVVRVTGPVNSDFAVATSTENVTGGNNDQALTSSVVQAATAVLPKIVDLTVGGTFEAGDKFSIRLGSADTLEVFGYAGTPDPVATIAKTFKSKMYTGSELLVDFSGVGRPDVWQRDHATVPGAGFIDPGSQDSGTVPVTGLEIYESLMAIFGKESIQLWTMSDDPSSNSFTQLLRNTGTVAPKSIKSFGSSDVFYDAQSGIRSLQARSGTSIGYAADVGSAIDEFVQEHKDTLTVEQREASCADIEPRNERYVLALGERNYVFSKFPNAEIAAWSYIEAGVQFTDIVRSFDRLYARAGDTVYVYGGLSRDTYPDAGEMNVIVDTPFYDMQSPATVKSMKGFDIAAVGTWELYALPNPNNTDILIPFGQIADTSFHLPRTAIDLGVPMVAFRLVCKSAGFAKLMRMAPSYKQPHEQR